MRQPFRADTESVLASVVVIAFLFSAAACTRSEPVPAPATTATTTTSTSFVTSMSLPNDADGEVRFDTGKSRGTITIAKGIPVGYRNTTTTTTAGTSTKTTLTVKDREIVIEEGRVRVGDAVIEPLPAEVRIEVRADGVFVDGHKAFDW